MTYTHLTSNELAMIEAYYKKFISITFKIYKSSHSKIWSFESWVAPFWQCKSDEKLVLLNKISFLFIAGMFS